MCRSVYCGLNNISRDVQEICIAAMMENSVYLTVCYIESCWCYEFEFRSLMAWGKKLLLSLHSLNRGCCFTQPLRYFNQSVLHKDPKKKIITCGKWASDVPFKPKQANVHAFHLFRYEYFQQRLTENQVTVDVIILVWEKIINRKFHQFVAALSSLSHTHTLL